MTRYILLNVSHIDLWGLIFQNWEWIAIAFHLCIFFPIGFIYVCNIRSLTEGHCLIVPLQHHRAATLLDEDIWEEIQVSMIMLIIFVMIQSNFYTLLWQILTSFIPSFDQFYISKFKHIYISIVVYTCGSWCFHHSLPFYFIESFKQIFLMRYDCHIMY